MILGALLFGTGAYLSDKLFVKQEQQQEKPKPELRFITRYKEVKEEKKKKKDPEEDEVKNEFFQ